MSLALALLGVGRVGVMGSKQRQGALALHSALPFFFFFQSDCLIQLKTTPQGFKHAFSCFLQLLPEGKTHLILSTNCCPVKFLTSAKQPCLRVPSTSWGLQADCGLCQWTQSCFPRCGGGLSQWGSVSPETSPPTFVCSFHRFFLLSSLRESI